MGSLKMEPLEISKKLFERYEKVFGNVENYFGLLALYALARVADEDGDAKAMQRCIEEMEKYPDRIVHPYYNYENFRVGGACSSWLAMKGLMDGKKEILREYAEKTLSAVTDGEGIVCRPDRYPERFQTWIDSIYSVCPFMLYCGIMFEEERYIDFAVSQCVKMYGRFTDRSCGLLHQTKGFMKDPEEISGDHWGRGNGWGYFGLTEFLRCLPKESRHYETIKELYLRHTEALIKYQTPKGMWGQEIACEYSWEESSGTALILYGMGEGILNGILDRDKYLPIFDRGINALTRCAVREDFMTLFCCYGCVCPGGAEGKGSPKSYIKEIPPMPDDPHSFGPFMLALLSAHKLGYTSLEMNNPKYYWEIY